MGWELKSDKIVHREFEIKDYLHRRGEMGRRGGVLLELPPVRFPPNYVLPSRKIGLGMMEQRGGILDVCLENAWHCPHFVKWGFVCEIYVVKLHCAMALA